MSQPRRSKLGGAIDIQLQWSLSQLLVFVNLKQSVKNVPLIVMEGSN